MARGGCRCCCACWCRWRRPGMAIVALFAFTQAWNEFLYALIYVYTDAARTLTSGLVGMMMGDVFIWGQLMAASTHRDRAGAA